MNDYLYNVTIEICVRRDFHVKVPRRRKKMFDLFAMVPLQSQTDLILSVGSGVMQEKEKFISLNTGWVVRYDNINRIVQIKSYIMLYHLYSDITKYIVHGNTFS